MEVINMGIATKHSPGEFCSRQIFDGYTLCCFATPYMYEKDGSMHYGKPGDVIINTPGEIVYHGDISSNGTGFVNDWIRLSGDELKDYLTRYPIPTNTAIHTQNVSFLRGFIDAVRSEVIIKKAGYADMICSLLFQIILELYRKTNDRDFKNETESRLSKARYEIIKNPQKKHSLESLAALCGYSPGRFSHLYKNIYGISPMQSVINERISMAKTLLEYGGFSISDVSSACGFENIYYFSKLFKQRTGIAPSRFGHKQLKQKH